MELVAQRAFDAGEVRQLALHHLHLQVELGVREVVSRWRLHQACRRANHMAGRNRIDYDGGSSGRRLHHGFIMRLFRRDGRRIRFAGVVGV